MITFTRYILPGRPGYRNIMTSTSKAPGNHARSILRLGCCLLAATWLASCSDGRDTFAIATGGTGGLYYPLGGGMASIWSRHLPGINVRAEVTGGSVINVIQVARGESELGIAMADVVTSAYLGEGRFPEPLPIRVLFAAYPNVVHIVTLRENRITSMQDLSGKRVSLGAAGSGTAVAARNVLEGLGLTGLVLVNLNFNETTSAIKDGTLDAGFVVGGLGLAAVTELGVTRNLHLVALDDAQLQLLSRRFPAYTGFLIPAGTYGGQDEAVQALGIWSVITVHEDMPKETARALTCTIFRQRADLMQISPVARAITPENIHRLPAVPLHPGSLAWLEAPGAACSGDET